MTVATTLLSTSLIIVLPKSSGFDLLFVRRCRFRLNHVNHCVLFGIFPFSPLLPFVLFPSPTSFVVGFCDSTYSPHVFQIIFRIIIHIFNLSANSSSQQAYTPLCSQRSHSFLLRPFYSRINTSFSMWPMDTRSAIILFGFCYIVF